MTKEDDCAQESNFSTFSLIYYLRKEKYKNGRFPHIALASRGGKRQGRIGFHYIQPVKFVQSLKKIIEK